MSINPFVSMFHSHFCSTALEAIFSVRNAHKIIIYDLYTISKKDHMTCMYRTTITHSTQLYF